MSDLRKRFEAAQAAAKRLRDKPDNDTPLELYSYFKQGSQGDVGGDRPGGFDFRGSSQIRRLGGPQGHEPGSRNAGIYQAGRASSVARGLT